MKPAFNQIPAVCPLCYWAPSSGKEIQKLADHLKKYHKAVEREMKGERSF